MPKSLWLLGLGLGLPMISGCGSSDGFVPFGEESPSEIAAGVVAGTVNATESGGNFVRAPAMPSLISFLIPSAFADVTICPTVISGTCIGNKMTLTYSACSFQVGGKTYESVWNGNQILTFDGGATCSVIPTANSSGTMTRAFSDNTTRTGVRGLSITFNTSTASGYDDGVVPQPSGGVVTTFASGARTLDIRGVHLNASYTATRGNNRGQTVQVWDHTVSTEANNTIAVVGTAQNRSINSGTVTVQNNIRKFTAKAKIEDALKFTSLCCYPTGGKIKTDFTGSRSGSETLEFGPNCGEAKLTDVQGTLKTITLRHCL